MWNELSSVENLYLAMIVISNYWEIYKKKSYYKKLIILPHIQTITILYKEVGYLSGKATSNMHLGHEILVYVSGIVAALSLILLFPPWIFYGSLLIFHSTDISKVTYWALRRPICISNILVVNFSCIPFACIFAPKKLFYSKTLV